MAFPVTTTPAPGVGQFTNVVKPQGIYTPQMTQQSKNQVVAHAHALADPRWAQKQFTGPGRSMDQGTLSAAMPSIGEALSSARLAQGQIPLSDMIANQSNLLSGQIAQDSESLGLSNMLARLNNDQTQNKLSWWNTLTGPLMSQIGGAF